jgi:tetratricopeptide (TPR) repeat protein
MGSVDAKKAALAHARLGELFLTFADKSTAAALQRDDAHFASEKDPAAALETYADLVARFPDDPQFREEIGALHEKAGNNLAAGVAYGAAMVLYLGSDDFVRANELVPRLLAVRPDDGAALELAARAFDRAGHSTESAAMLDRALAAYRTQHRASDVERVCRRLAETVEDPVPYRRELAKLLQEVGDLPGAIEQLTEAAERSIQWSRGQEALAALKDAEALAVGDPIFAERIAGLKLRAADAVKAVDDSVRGDLFLSRGEFEKAADSYRRAVAENPNDAGAAYQLACLLTDHFPDFDTAERLLETAAALRPGHTATRYRMAVVKAARGEIGQAIELLIALARFDDANADFIEQFVARLERAAEGGDVAAKYNLGIAYRELGRVEEALVILQSIQREPEFVVRCLNAIGLCLRRQGLDTAAAKRFQKAIETSGFPEGQYNDALYNLGDLYESKTDQESLALSLSSFEELYARDCTYRDVADKIRSVKSKIGSQDGPKVKRLPTRSAELSN